MKERKWAALLGVMLSALIFSACGGDSSTGGVGDGVSYGSLPDSRDGQTYKTVVIGTQTWMAQNLNYDVDSSWCYENSADSCARYGRLYQWAAAMDLNAFYNSAEWDESDVDYQGVCPSGWHLPSDAEWTILENFAGGLDIVGAKLRSTGGWYDDGGNGFVPGTDVYGFSALPAGYRDDDGRFDGAGRIAVFWSATENSAYYGYPRYLHYDCEFMDIYNEAKSLAFSVRCLRN